MRRYVFFAVGLAVVIAVAVTAGAGDRNAPSGDGRQETITGALRAAPELFAETDKGKADAPADRKALARGLPGGVVTDKGFTLLLIDGRVLATLGAAQPAGENVVRVSGVLHDGGRSMSPSRIEYQKDGKWIAFDLPLSGTTAPGVQGGDQ